MAKEEPTGGTVNLAGMAGVRIAVCQQALHGRVAAEVAGDDAQGARLTIARGAVVHPEAGEVEHVRLGGTAQEPVAIARSGVEDGHAKEFAASEDAQGQTDGGGRCVEVVAGTDEFGRHAVGDGRWAPR